MKKGGNILKDKSFGFAVRIVKLVKILSQNQEYVIGRQILRAGTYIGAMVCEAEFAQSRADFVSKMSIALKEANETFYWLRLLNATEYINDAQFNSMTADVDEIISLLVKSIKTAKNNEK
jgi:four helix bundle protein